jgi:hypothetical protein
MIWFFLMGMIAGAVGVIMILRWWIRTHMKKVSPEEFFHDLHEAGYTDEHVPDHPEGREVSEQDGNADDKRSGMGSASE